MIYLRRATSLIFVLAFMTSPLAAQVTLLSGNHSIDGQLCAGTGCNGAESFGLEDVKIKSITPRLRFDDSSTNVSNSQRDWSIIANDTNNDFLGFVDDTAGRIVFQIDGDAPSNSLYIADDGKVGLGTSLPTEMLHIIADSNPAIRLESALAPMWAWEVVATPGAFSIEDAIGGTIPFVLNTLAPDHSINVEVSGDLGLGTQNPQGKLHSVGSGNQIIYFESESDDAVQVRFRSDSENRRFLATDGADNVKTQMQFRDNSIVFLGQTVAQEWLNVSAAGITTAGPTCNPGPCDATFDPEVFEVPSIEDHAAYMWENQHLWAVGPTTPKAPINLTEKMGGVIHELEVAHIYIEQLHGEIATIKAELAALKRR